MASNALLCATCPSCGASYAPRRPHQRYCSDHCRWAAFDGRRQRALDFTPPAEPIPSPVDPSVHPADAPRLGKAALAMYARLLRGPATEEQLRLAGAGRRVAARRLDLAVWLERIGSPYRIPKAERTEYGDWLYRLEER